MTLKSHDLAHIRSVVLAGHAGAGKTTLAEQVLFRAGAIPRLGRVDDGTAHLDYEPEEQKQHRSLSLAVGTFEHGEHEITLVDTPGYPDFVAEMIEGFHAADAALFVIDASGGVEAGPRDGGQGRPRDRAPRPASCSTSATARTRTRRPRSTRCAPTFGNKIAPLHLAIGAADTFSGYVDLVHRKAYRFEGGKEVEIPIPAELADEVARRRDQLLEAAAEADDDVFEKYLGEEEISRRGARRVPPQGRPRVGPGAGAGRLGGEGHRPQRAARRDRPLPPLARGGGPVRRDRQGRQGGRGRGRTAGQLLVRVFKTAADPFVGRLTYLRVLSGTLKSQGAIVQRHEGRGRADRPAAVPPRQGAGAGAGAAGGRDRRGREARRDRDRRHALDPRAPGSCCRRSTSRSPTLQVAIEPVSKGDLDKMGPALQRMLEEEPTARVERSDTGEQILRAIGEAHVAVITERLKRKFGAAIATRTPTVPYRETIRGTTKAHGRYKKQTGGHGMFGDVWIELEPNPAAGVEFADKVVGGSVPKGFFAGIEKGIRETAAEGVFAGLPADRLQGDAVRRVVPPGRLERAVVQDRGLDGAQGRRAPGEARPARADHDTSRSGSPSSTWARSTATSTAAAAACWAWTSPTGMQVITRPRAPGGAVLVRDRAAVADRRPRARSARPSTTTRTCRRTSPRRSSARTRRTGTARATDRVRRA